MNEEKLTTWKGSDLTSSEVARWMKFSRSIEAGPFRIGTESWTAEHPLDRAELSWRRLFGNAALTDRSNVFLGIRLALGTSNE